MRQRESHDLKHLRRPFARVGIHARERLDSLDSIRAVNDAKNQVSGVGVQQRATGQTARSRHVELKARRRRVTGALEYRNVCEVTLQKTQRDQVREPTIGSSACRGVGSHRDDVGPRSSTGWPAGMRHPAPGSRCGPMRGRRPKGVGHVGHVHSRELTIAFRVPGCDDRPAVLECGTNYMPARDEHAVRDDESRARTSVAVAWSGLSTATRGRTLP